MITKSELEKLLASTETYRVERTKSTTDKDKFGEAYLSKAVDAEILATDDRPIERKLESLRFFNSAYGLPTNAAVLLFGKDPRRFFPGAYVQLRVN